MTDSAREIENLLYTYAARVDAGDLDGVAALLEHGRIRGSEDGPPAVFTGSAGVRQMFSMAIHLYEDETPKTKHFTTNVLVEVDDDGRTARSAANYLVTQATPTLPLQVIVTGRYQDTFQRIDDAWWFDTRTMFVDQRGDTSHHLKF